MGTKAKYDDCVTFDTDNAWNAFLEFGENLVEWTII
jgi:hypothetical protein